MKKHITISNVLASVGLILAIFFYLEGRKVRRPVWKASSKILIYNKNQTENNFILLNKDSTEIKENIYAQELTIWNAGELTIKHEDVRIPISLVFNDDVKLIDYRIIKEKSSIKNNFSFTEKDNRLILNWKYFDPGDGVQVKHIYSSKNGKYPSIKGEVLGNKLMVAKYLKHEYSQYFVVLFFLIFCVFSFKATKDVYRMFIDQKKESNSSNKNELLKKLIVMSIATFIFMCLMVFGAYQSYSSYTTTFKFPF